MDSGTGPAPLLVVQTAEKGSTNGRLPYAKSTTVFVKRRNATVSHHSSFLPSLRNARTMKHVFDGPRLLTGKIQKVKCGCLGNLQESVATILFLGSQQKKILTLNLS